MHPAFTPLRYGCGPLTWLAVGYVGWHGAEVQRRAALGILQCVPDVPDNGGRLKADLARRQVEHHDLVFAHPTATGEGLLVVLRGQVPFARSEERRVGKEWRWRWAGGGDIEKNRSSVRCCW